MHTNAERATARAFKAIFETPMQDNRTRERIKTHAEIERLEQEALDRMQQAEDLRKRLVNPPPVTVREDVTDAGFMPLHMAAAKVVAQYANQSEAAREFGIGKAYLSRLMSGIKSNPGDDVLDRMGLVRIVRTGYAVKGTV